MLETPHVIVGAAIAIKVVNPALALPLAFASHFVLEQIPHWNPHINTEKKKYGKITSQSLWIIVADVLASLAVGGYIAASTLPDTSQAATVLLACFASVLPDVVEAPYFFLNVQSPLLLKWLRFQKSLQNDAAALPGLATQVVTSLAALWWIFD